MSSQVVPTPARPAYAGTALQRGYWVCLSCHALCTAPPRGEAVDCARCGATVHARKPQSLARCWAYLMAAAVLYVPANLLPVTVTASVFDTQRDTIFSGIVYLWADGSWPLAALVFIASIVVPLCKLMVLTYLLLAVQWRRAGGAGQRTRLYRLLEFIGRWSMLDVYVITWLAALVQIQSLASITPGPGAMAFGAVVVLTMLATHQFDPRLLWDAADPAGAAAMDCSAHD